MVQRGINLDLEAWDIPDVLTKGDWKKLSFNYDSRSIIGKKPAIRGVYMIILKPTALQTSSEPFSLFNATVYTGQTTNMYKRFCWHTYPRTFQTDNTYKKLVNHWRHCMFYYLEIPDTSEKQLEFLEGKLQTLFGPVINERNAPSGQEETEEVKEIRGKLEGIEGV